MLFLLLVDFECLLPKWQQSHLFHKTVRINENICSTLYKLKVYANVIYDFY